ncbi:MAG: RNA-binding protein [Nanoarchaeota archaeon]|nr:RNA-binding protein [Nanoarchaeota archaeon]
MTNKVYVGNLPFKYGFKELKDLFEKFGEIQEALVVSDKYSGRSKGFGFVTFTNEESAKKAVEEMNGKDADGRPLKVSVATPRSEEDAKPAEKAEESVTELRKTEEQA